MKAVEKSKEENKITSERTTHCNQVNTKEIEMMTMLLGAMNMSVNFLWIHTCFYLIWDGSSIHVKAIFNLLLTKNSSETSVTSVDPKAEVWLMTILLCNLLMILCPMTWKTTKLYFKAVSTKSVV